VSQEIKITRSFSAKVNLGNYENVDVSCSAQAMVPAEQMDSVSDELYSFCRNQVREEVDAIKRRKGGGNA
jgi:hypothetical protein